VPNLGFLYLLRIRKIYVVAHDKYVKVSETYWYIYFSAQADEMSDVFAARFVFSPAKRELFRGSGR
jgi:hypothetical protein